jgi:hypothetical protein
LNDLDPGVLRDGGSSTRKNVSHIFCLDYFGVVVVVVVLVEVFVPKTFIILFKMFFPSKIFYVNVNKFSQNEIISSQVS